MGNENILHNNRKLTRCSWMNSLIQDGSWNGLFPVRREIFFWGLGFTRGLAGTLSPYLGWKNTIQMINPSEPWLATLLAHFPLTLRLPLKSTLDPPSVNPGQSPLKVPRPAAQSEIQNGGFAISPRNRFPKHFPHNYPLNKFDLLAAPM